MERTKSGISVKPFSFPRPRLSDIINSMRTRRDILYLLLLAMAVIIFHLPSLKPGRVFFLRDISGEVIPRRAFWVEAHGFYLWNPRCFFGLPEAANPQTEAFYPFNFWFMLMGAERGLVFYIFFHHLLFLLTLYPAVRRLGFGPEASLISSAGFGFGGFISSMTNLILHLSTVAWLPLLILLLSQAARNRWLRPGLLLGPVIAFQILAGEPEAAAMCWALALGAVCLGPVFHGRPREWLRLGGALAAGILGGIVLSLPQISLTMQYLPLTNRGAGLGLEAALDGYLQKGKWLSFFIPNHFLPASAGRLWGLGRFNNFPYFHSYYVGISVWLMALAALWNRHKVQVWIWVGLAAFSVAAAQGPALPVYSFLFQHLPGFNLFRMPEKFLFPFGFAIFMLSAYGAQTLEARFFGRPRLAVVMILAGVLVSILLMVLPLHPAEFGDNYVKLANQLFLHAVVRTAGILLIAAGIILSLRPQTGLRIIRAMPFLIALDLIPANYLVNPTVDRSFYRASRPVAEMSARSRNRVFPIRIATLKNLGKENTIDRTSDPISLYSRLENELSNFGPAYFHLDDVTSYSTFDLAEVDRFLPLLDWKTRKADNPVLARAGIEYLSYKDRGFIALPTPISRAAIYYHAARSESRDEIVQLWKDPNFPAQAVVLLEAEPEEVSGAPRMRMSDPAKIVVYRNEQVVIEAEAKDAGWLVLLDTFYPGWKAEVDRRPEKIYRANGFFRAVKIPPGRHQVVFSYRPAAFYRALEVSLAGLALWTGLLALALRKNTPG